MSAAEVKVHADDFKKCQDEWQMIRKKHEWWLTSGQKKQMMASKDASDDAPELSNNENGTQSSKSTKTAKWAKQLAQSQNALQALKARNGITDTDLDKEVWEVDTE